MKIKNKHILFLLVILIAIHFIARSLGLYEGKVWIDIPQHILGGILLAMIWLKIIQHQKIPKIIVFISIITFSVFGSFVWEAFEFLFWTFFPDYALSLKWFSPTVSDTLSDLFAGFIGGTIVAILTVK